MNIEKIIEEVIPPRDYAHRNGFNNIPIIDGLTEVEKQLLEKGLLQKLQMEAEKEIDTLIVSTLAYLKSKQSIPVLYHLLEICNIDEVKLEIAAYVYEINQDIEMIDMAISCFNKIANRKDAYATYALISAFYKLVKLDSPNVNAIIKEYINDKEYLIAFNAKQALGKRVV